jgi:hypothetical protein
VPHDEARLARSTGQFKDTRRVEPIWRSDQHETNPAACSQPHNTTARTSSLPICGVTAAGELPGGYGVLACVDAGGMERMCCMSSTRPVPLLHLGVLCDFLNMDPEEFVDERNDLLGV